MQPEHHPFFHGWDPLDRDRLLQLAEIVSYPEGAILFHEGDPADWLYLITGGTVTMFRELPGGGERPLAEMTVGEYFGEVSVLDGQGRSTTARCTTDARFVRLPGGPLMDALHEAPGRIALGVFRRVQEHLRKMDARYIDETVRKHKLTLVGEMASSIIHDFKNPITGIQLAAELLALTHKEDAMTTKYCGLIRQQTERMVAMAQELLDYSRGQPRIEPELIATSALLAEFEALNADYLRSAGVRLEVTSCDCSIRVDRLRFLRVLQNLVSNAVDAVLSRPDPHISINCWRETGGDMIITVRDNGAGVPEVIRTSIFLPFVSHGKRQGTGLGMPISRSIVEAHGGTIDFVSESGVGTTFTIRLPDKVNVSAA